MTGTLGVVLKGAVRRGAWLLLIAVLSSAIAHGAEVVDTAAKYAEGTLTMRSEILIDVPVDRVRAILTDYENLPEVSKDLKRVLILERFADGRVRMRADSEICVLSICLDFAWMQDARVTADGDIVVTILPRQGSFKGGSGRWTLREDKGHTRLTFDIELVPAFWLPPVFGPWFIKRKLLNEIYETSVGLERKAAEGEQ